MARITYEDLKVYWVAAIANTSGPTAAEMTAGTDLSSLVPVDGYNEGGTRNNAAQAMLGDAFVSELPGTWGSTLEMTFVRDPAADTAWDLFAGAYGTTGHIVISRVGAGTTAGDEVEVIPVETHEPQPEPSAENEFQKFTVSFAVTSAPVRDAVVAA